MSSQIESFSGYNNAYIGKPIWFNYSQLEQMDFLVNLYEYINWYKGVSELLKDADNLLNRYKLNSENLVKNDVVNDGRSYEVFFKDMHDKKHIMQLPEGDYMNLIALAIYRRQNLNDQEKKQWLQTILEKEQNHLDFLHQECKAKYIKSFKKKFKNDLVFLKETPFYKLKPNETNSSILDVPNGKLYLKCKYSLQTIDAYKTFRHILDIKKAQDAYHNAIRKSLLKNVYIDVIGRAHPLDISEGIYDSRLSKIYKKRTGKELALSYDSARNFLISDPTILDGLKAVKKGAITKEEILKEIRFCDKVYNDSLNFYQSVYNRYMDNIEKEFKDISLDELKYYLNRCGLLSSELSSALDPTYRTDPRYFYDIYSEGVIGTGIKIREVIKDAIASAAYADTDVKYEHSDDDLYYYFNDSICYSITPSGFIKRTIKKLCDGRWSLFENNVNSGWTSENNPKANTIIVFNKKTPFEILPYVPNGCEDWENFKKLGMAGLDDLISYGFVDMKGVFWLKNSMKKRDYTENSRETLGRIERANSTLQGDDDVWTINASYDSWFYENPTIVRKNGFPTNNIEDYVLAEGTNYVTGTSYRECMEIGDYNKLAEKVENAMLSQLLKRNNPVYYDIERNYGHAVAEECKRHNYQFYKGMPKDLVLNNLADPKFIRSDSRGNSVYEYYGTYYYFRNGKLDHWTTY